MIGNKGNLFVQGYLTFLLQKLILTRLTCLLLVSVMTMLHLFVSVPKNTLIIQ